MKISKRQLKRIIKEEKAKLLREGRVGDEGTLLGVLLGVIKDLETISHELPGLTDPDGADMGFVYSEELDATIEDLYTFKKELDVLFESYDDLAGRNPGGSIG